MQPWSFDAAGRFEEHTIASDALRGNPLGDPHERPVWVYVPPGYDDDEAARFPSVYMIQGLTGQLDMWRNRSPFRRNFPELADDLFARGEAPPVVVVWVDAWTSYGGSQFLDSPGTGNYLTYLCDEVVPFVDERYRTIADRDHRGIAGSRAAGTVRWSCRCSAPSCGAGSRRTPATRCSRRATSRSSVSRPVRCATTTRARSRSSGRTSAADRRSRRPPTAIC